MDNIDTVVSSDCEMIGIWTINYKLIIKWLMYNDMGNVDHLLSIYLFPYSPTHPPTYLPTYHMTKDPLVI
jgi:hypothetical protein